MNRLSAYIITSILLVGAVSSCTHDIKLADESLAKYISERSGLTPFNELIACAAGSMGLSVSTNDYPISIFYYPVQGATDFRIFSTENSVQDPLDLENFIEIQAPDEALFNGFMKRFLLDDLTERWIRTTYIANDTLWYCKPIRLKYFTKPTEENTELCGVADNEPLNPIFFWADGLYQDNIIYFELFSDDDLNVITATYTEDGLFEFYNTQNVVLNLTPSANPTIDQGESYIFTMMGVSQDNWVNLFFQKLYQP